MIKTAEATKTFVAPAEDTASPKAKNLSPFRIHFAPSQLAHSARSVARASQASVRHQQHEKPSMTMRDH
jgi:hypothetical protein